MRHHRWLEFVKDYQFDIHYHPSKANLVVDTLSRRPVGDLAVEGEMEGTGTSGCNLPIIYVSHLLNLRL